MRMCHRLSAPMPRRTHSTAPCGTSKPSSAGKPVWSLAGLPQPQPAVTAYTLSLDTPEAMGEAAAKASARPLLKLKLGREGDAERLKLIRSNAPNSRLIVDANEGWTPENLPAMLAACADVGVELVEQPLPAGNDEALRHIKRAVTVCADESAHGLDSLDAMIGKYDAINIKLDKTGGLTPAIALARGLEGAGLEDHGGLHAGDLARHGARLPALAAGRIHRPRRPPAAETGSRARHPLRRQPDVSAAR